MARKELDILVVDDSPDDRELIRRLFAKNDEFVWHIQEAAMAYEALRLCRHHHFDCVLLDYSLPGQDGLRVLKELRLEDLDVPVVMLTGQGNEEIAATAMRNGAQDYLTKGMMSASNLVKAIQMAVQRKKQELLLIQQANYDDLTGAISRHRFMEYLDLAQKRADRFNRFFAVLYLDLDGFKVINDAYGHDVGDALLVEVVKGLQGCIRDSDILARIGGDEFVILFEDLAGDGVEDCKILAERIIQCAKDHKCNIKGHDLAVGFSIGIAIYPTMAPNTDQLLRLADQAMYAAKNSDEKQYQFAA